MLKIFIDPASLSERFFAKSSNLNLFLPAGPEEADLLISEKTEILKKAKSEAIKIFIGEEKGLAVDNYFKALENVFINAYFVKDKNIVEALVEECQFIATPFIERGLNGFARKEDFIYFDMLWNKNAFGRKIDDICNIIDKPEEDVRLRNVFSAQLMISFFLRGDIPESINVEFVADEEKILFLTEFPSDSLTQEKIIDFLKTQRAISRNLFEDANGVNIMCQDGLVKITSKSYFKTTNLAYISVFFGKDKEENTIKQIRHFKEEDVRYVNFSNVQDYIEDHKEEIYPEGEQKNLRDAKNKEDDLKDLPPEIDWNLIESSLEEASQGTMQIIREARNMSDDLSEIIQKPSQDANSSREIQKLLNRQEVMTKRLSGLSENIEVLRNENVSLKRRLRKETLEKQSLAMQIKENEDSEDKKEKDIDEWDKIDESLKGAHSDSQDIAREAEEVSKKMDEVLKSQVEDKQKIRDLEKLKGRYDVANKRIAGLTENIDRVKHEKELIKQQLHLERSKNTQEGNKIQSLQADNVRLKKEIAQLSLRRKSSYEEIERIKKQKRSREEEIRRLQRHVQKAGSEKQKLEKEIVILERKLSRGSTSSDSNKNVDEQSGKNYDRMRREYEAKLKTQTLKERQLNTQITSLKQNLSRIENSEKMLKVENRDMALALSRQETQMSDLKKEYEKLKVELQREKKKDSDAGVSDRSSGGKFFEMEKQIKKLEMREKNANAQLENYKKQYAKLEESERNLKAESRTFITEINKKDVQTETLKKDLARLKQENSMLKKEKEKAAGLGADRGATARGSGPGGLQRAINDAEKKLKRKYELEMQKLMAMVSNLKKNNESTERQLKGLRDNLTDLSRKYTGEIDNGRKKDAKIRELMTKLEQVKKAG